MMADDHHQEQDGTQSDHTIQALRAEMAQRDRMSESLAYSRARLKRISRHTLDVLEADRRNISRELHDSIGASLSAIKFSLEEKQLRLETQDKDSSLSLEHEIRTLRDTIKETKRISAHLRPTILDDLGLLATIDWYLRQFQRMYGEITVRYRVDVKEEDVPEPVKINIYRIIQESMSNAERHGNANRIDMSLGFCDGRSSVSLLIKDNGQGFDLERLHLEEDPMSGYGLTAMRERCEIFGGSFHLDSTVGHGTRINAILPVD